jgi:hypothetical protein
MNNFSLPSGSKKTQKVLVQNVYISCLIIPAVFEQRVDQWGLSWMLLVAASWRLMMSLAVGVALRSY